MCKVGIYITALPVRNVWQVIVYKRFYRFLLHQKLEKLPEKLDNLGKTGSAFFYIGFWQNNACRVS